MNVAVFLCALTAAVLLGPNGPVYWDGFGYVSQAIDGHIGGLILGRPLFVIVSHALERGWVLLGRSVFAVEPMLRTFWLLVSAGGPVLLRLVALEAGLSPRGALLAAVSLAVSPSFAHTSNAVLTDAPAVTALLASYLFALRATREGHDGAAHGLFALGAGAWLGVAFGLREPSVFHALGLGLCVARAPREQRFYIASAVAAGFALTAAPPVVYAAATQHGYADMAAGWYAAMKRERALHPYRAVDFAWFLAWLVAAGPALVAGAGWAWVALRKELFRPGSALFVLCVPSLAQLALLATYQDISFSPRYLLCAVPGALCIPAALAVDRAWQSREPTRGAVAAITMLLLAPLFAGVGLVRARQQRLVRALRETPARLESSPRPAVVVTGQPCPGVDLYMTQLRALGHPETWDKVCPGWSWPDDLDANLDAAFVRGAHVIADLREEVWLGPRQQHALDQLRAYVAARPGRVTDGSIVLWQ